MLRTALLALIFLVSLSSSSILRKVLTRRQSEPQHCQAIEGFDCKCSYYRVTCTNDRGLPSPINIVQNEKHKYQSVELVITAATNVEVNDRTFESIKELYKPDGDNFEFRLKFEKFTALHLSSPGLFNRILPDNLPSNARKTFALEIYNTEVQPNDNVNLFQNLNADSLELYALYPFRGTFQQLFNGANIKYIRLSGGDIRSDLSQTFTGNIGRLEIAKQANALSVQNFPVYPAHELVINAFFITDFNPEHPPNYDNLVELRVQSPDRIPANAFRNFPNLRVLSVGTEKDIDPNALDGLNKLEKLTIANTKSPPAVELLQKLSNVKEFETNVDKLDEKTQCQLIEKLASGQVAVQAIPNGRECTCVSAYLDTATGRSPCNAEHCEHSSCAAIKNNYDASTRTFNAPPSIRRADGTDALHYREPQVYSTPFQVSQQDQEKLLRGSPHQQPPPQSQPEYDNRRPEGEQDHQQHTDQHQNPSDTRHPSQTSYDDHNSHNTHDHQKSDQDDDTSDVENNRNENTENVEKTPWGYPDDHGSRHDSHQTDPVQSEWDSDSDTTTFPVDRSQWDHPEDHGANHNSHRTEPVQSEWDSDSDTTTFPVDESQWDHPEDHGANHNSHRIEPVQPEGDSDRDATTAVSLSNDDDNQGRPDQDGNREGGESGPRPEGEENRPEGEGNDNQPNRQGNENQPDAQGGRTDGGENLEGGATNGTETASPPPKRGMSWLPIIIIAASILVLLIIGVIIIFIRKRSKDYQQAPGSEPATARA